MGGFVDFSIRWSWIRRINTVKIDPKSNWLKLPILSLIVISNTQFHSIVFLSLYRLYITLKCLEYSAFEQFSPYLNSGSISLFAIQPLLIVMDISMQYTKQIKSNIGIHSRSLPLYSCLFNITILWDYPVQSSSFTW